MASCSETPPYESIENGTQQYADTDSELSDAPDNLSTWSEAEQDTRYHSSSRSEIELTPEPDARTQEGVRAEKQSQKEQEPQVAQPARAEEGRGFLSPHTPVQGLGNAKLQQNFNSGQPSNDRSAPIRERAPRGSHARQPADHASTTRSYDANASTKCGRSKVPRVSRRTSSAKPPYLNVPPVTPRRSGRSRRTPARFNDLVYEGTSPELRSDSRSVPGTDSPEESLSASPSPILRLKLRRNLLHRFSDSEAVSTDMSDQYYATGKRKDAPDGQSAPPPKRIQNQQPPENKNQPSTTTPAVSDLIINSHPKPIPGDEDVLLSVPRHNSTDSYLWVVAGQLRDANPFGGEKPEASGEPPIWAARRSDLCETLPYFRSFHSGDYCTSDTARGFLFSSLAFERDFMDASVTVTRAGGGMTVNEDGKRDQVSDQEAKKNTRDLMNNMKRHRPVVHITTNDNPCLPSKAPHEYCVLGHYKITHIWMEKKLKGNKHINFLRYRFEKLDAGGEEIWWLPKGTTEAAPRGSLPPPATRKCTKCTITSEQVYLQGWMCLNEDCESHWKLVTMSGELRDPTEASLVFDPRFLKQKTAPWSTENHSFDLMPNDPVIDEDAPTHCLYNMQSWKGIVCPGCSCCISRVGFQGWKCETPECGYQKIPPRKVIPAASMREMNHRAGDSYPLSEDWVSQEVIEEQPIHGYNYTIVFYRFEGVKGFVAHMMPTERVLIEPGGPDDMFKELQLVDVGLERRINGSITNKAASYTRHMNVNSGMPYKFGAANINKNVSFDDSPAASIPEARSRLKWATELVFALNRRQGDQNVPEEMNADQFNELLTLGYFQDQRIDYHDDGEKGLGPTVATLSLGSPGSFKLRMKRTPYNGVSKGGVYDYEHAPIPGCFEYEARSAAHEGIKNNAPKKDATSYYKQWAKDLNLKSSRVAKPLLDLTLKHGSILIMHGSILQDCFEHGVSHTGLLRFAMTCRYIDPASVPEGIINYTVGPDRIGYDGTKLPLPRDHLGNPIEDIFGKLGPEAPGQQPKATDEDGN